MDELAELVTTLGVPICDKMLLHHREMHARFLIGSGKAQELADRAKAEKLDVIIFDNELTPSQQRNWESSPDITGDRPPGGHHRHLCQARANPEARLQIDLSRLMLPPPDPGLVPPRPPGRRHRAKGEGKIPARAG